MLSAMQPCHSQFGVNMQADHVIKILPLLEDIHNPWKAHFFKGQWKAPLEAWDAGRIATRGSGSSDGCRAAKPQEERKYSHAFLIRFALRRYCCWRINFLSRGESLERVGFLAPITSFVLLRRGTISVANLSTLAGKWHRKQARI